MSNSHADWINSVIDDEQYQKEYEVQVQKNFNGDRIVAHPDKYKPEYDQLAYEAVADENGCGSIVDICVCLKCGRDTVKSWIKRHPSFRRAISDGRAVGEKNFRAKIRKHAFEPTSSVNNGLIKLLASNVHGIREDITPQVVINNRNETTVNQGEETSRIYEDALNKAENKEISI
jgi:hypothetical protein